MNASIIRDDVYREIFLAVESLNDYTELDIFDAVFEAEEGDKDTASVVAKNEEAKTGAIGHIKKAIDALRAMIANFFKNIASKFDEMKMEKEEKEAYLKFKEAVKNDPSIKNKTVTVKDYRKIKEDWAKMEKEFAQADEALKRGQETDVEKLVNKWKDSLKSMSGAVGSAVGLEMAVNMAKENRLAATAFSMFFKQCPEVLDKMSESLDEKSVQKDVKKIQTYTKRCYIRRWFLGITKQLYGSATDAAIGTLKDVGEAINKPSKFITNSTARHVAQKSLKNKDIKNVVNSGGTIAGEMAKGYAKGKVDAAVGTAKGSVTRKINQMEKNDFADNVNKEKEAIARHAEDFKRKVLKKESVDEALDDMETIFEVKESNLADGSTGTNQGGSTPQVSSANVKKEQQALKNENDKELKKVEQDIEKSSTNPLK